jgi:hypothetical protein
MNGTDFWHRTTLRRVAVSGCALIWLVGCTTPRQAGVKDVPPSLAPPLDQVLAISAHGAGVQIYTCQGSVTKPAAFAWNLTAPEAVLRYDGGKELGRHFAGPTWAASDGSAVVGEVTARVAGTDAAALPWLLLRAKTHSGSGVFSGIEFIQRLHTAGGEAPVAGCTAGYAGTTVRVDYSADYYFYRSRH